MSETEEDARHEEDDESQEESKEREDDKPKPDDLKTEGKKDKKRKACFTEDILIGRNGLPRIYDHFPRLAAFKGRGFESQDSKKLMNLYKEWASQLYPGLNFKDMLSQIETFGGRGKTRTALSAFREQERNRYLRETCGIEPRVPNPESTLRDGEEEDKREDVDVDHS